MELTLVTFVFTLGIATRVLGISRVATSTAKRRVIRVAIASHSPQTALQLLLGLGITTTMEICPVMFVFTPGFDFWSTTVEIRMKPRRHGHDTTTIKLKA